MTQATEMRRLMTLVEAQQIDEIGRFGKWAGAAAIGLSALAGAGGTAQAQTPQMDAAWQQVARTVQTLPNKDQVIAKIGNPTQFLQTAKAQGSQQSDEELLNAWTQKAARVSVDLQAGGGDQAGSSGSASQPSNFWDAQNRLQQRLVNR